MLFVLIVEQGLFRFPREILGARILSAFFFLKEHVTVESVEQTGKAAANDGSNDVVGHIVDKIASRILQVSDTVETKSHRDSRIEACSKFAASLNHTEKRKCNTKSA